MLSGNNNTDSKNFKIEKHNGNAKLWALLRKKGKRDTAGFKKAFGKDPEFPSANALRKIAW